MLRIIIKHPAERISIHLILRKTDVLNGQTRKESRGQLVVRENAEFVEGKVCILFLSCIDVKIIAYVTI